MERDTRDDQRAAPSVNPWIVWGGATLFLLLGIFGFRGTLVISLVIIVAFLGIVAACQPMSSSISSRYLLDMEMSRLPTWSAGVQRWEKEASVHAKPPKADIRMTGSAVVDEPLHDIIQYTLRDFVQIWYSPVSPDQEFLNGLHQLARRVAVSFASRSKEVDWVSYVTTKLVEDVINHLRLFKAAQLKQEELFLTIQTAGEEIPSLVDCFFGQELAYEGGKLCHDRVCKEADWERRFLRELSDVLLYSLLPPEDFRVQSVRYLLRELLVSSFLLPTIDLLSDPDYINQTIIWMCKSVPVTSEAFLTVVRISTDLDELEAVREKVKAEISALRSKDSGGEMDTEIKRQLSSVVYVQKVLDERVHWLTSGRKTCDPSGLDWTRLPESVRCINLPLEDVLNNDVAVSYFLEFLHSSELQHHMYLFLSAERWRVAAEKALTEIKTEAVTGGGDVETRDRPSPAAATATSGSGKESSRIRMENLRGPALRIFQQYLAERAVQRVRLDENLVHALYQRIQFDEEPKTYWFESIQNALREKFLEDPFLPSFKRSQLYVKLLAELDLLRDGLVRSDEEDAVSVDDDLAYSDTGSIGSSESAAGASSGAAPSTSPLPPPLVVCGNGGSSSSISSYNTDQHHLHPEAQLSRSPSQLSGDVSTKTTTTTNVFSTAGKQKPSEFANSVFYAAKGQQQFADDGSTLFVEIRDTKIVREIPKSFAVYTVYAKRVPADADKHRPAEKTTSNGSVVGSGPSSGWASPASLRKNLGVIEWTVDRRYSDFYDFHNVIRDNFGDLAGVHFPGKRTFNNLQKDFLGERKAQLNEYLRSLVAPGVIKLHPGLRERLYQFLGEGHYIQRTVVERRVMDPLKSMKNVLLSAPETIKAKIDGMTQAAPKPAGLTSSPSSSSSVGGGGGGGVPGVSGSSGVLRDRFRDSRHSSPEFGKFVWTDPWTLDGDDAVHMRILLVVLEEIFSVRDATAWRLRPRMVSALRHLLQAMFGNIYNRRLRLYLQWATSYEQVASYLRTVRNNLWPNGSLALPNPPREKGAKKRTEIAAKAALLSFVPDDLRSLLGTETTRHGILRVYELFQYQTLNRRLVYVLLEGILEVIFPANRLGKLFHEFHGKSPLLAGAGGGSGVGGHKRGGSRDLTRSPISRSSKKPT